MKSLRDYRLRAGLTQAELAETAEIRVATLSSLENGKSQAREATLISLADGLKIDVEDLRLAMRPDISEKKQNIINQVENDWLFLEGLDKDLRTGLAQTLVAEWTHSSTALEGNTISAGDTLFILTEGLTISGKSLHEHQEIHGHAQALSIMSHWVKSDLPIRIESLHQLHRSVQTESVVDIYQPIGSWKVEPNGTMLMPSNGKTSWHGYTLPKNVPPLVKDWLKLLSQHCQESRRISKNHKHPTQFTTEQSDTLIKAYTDVHLGFVAIHPYADGNGRLARLVSNIPLLRAGLPPLLISKKERRTYINLLGDYTLSIGQINDDEATIKQSKEYNALRDFFLKQWQTTLDNVADFHKIQQNRESVKED